MHINQDTYSQNRDLNLCGTLCILRALCVTCFSSHRVPLSTTHVCRSIFTFLHISALRCAGTENHREILDIFWWSNELLQFEFLEKAIIKYADILYDQLLTTYYILLITYYFLIINRKQFNRELTYVAE